MMLLLVVLIIANVNRIRYVFLKIWSNDRSACRWWVVCIYCRSVCDVGIVLKSCGSKMIGLFVEFVVVGLEL